MKKGKTPRPRFKIPRPRFEIDRNKEFFARFIARNGRETWRTSETLKKKSSVKRAIALLGTKFPILDRTLKGTPE